MFLLGLLLPICFIPGYTGASIPSQWVLLSLVLPAALWRRGYRLTPLHLLGLGFIAWAVAVVGKQGQHPKAAHVGVDVHLDLRLAVELLAP